MTSKKTILLADDDEAIRKLVTMVLQAQKFNVLIADCGESAQALSESFDGPIDLLLTDIVMPKMHGTELADILCKVRTEMRVIFMSGYPGDSVLDSGVCHEKLFFLRKPFAIPAVLEMVNTVLALHPSDLKNADHG